MKKIFKIISFLTILTFLTGCIRSPFLEPDRVMQKSLAWTKKGEIYNSLEIKASIFATYLNPLGKNSSDDEEFVVSIFIDDDFKEPELYGLNNPDISLTLNGINYTYKKELEEDDPLKKIVPFKNEWSHYYLVKFPKTDEKTLKLTLTSQNYGKTTLIFQKP